jgi:uroporphyrinogen-III synthase/uroporphyrinogen III methyltransferase/synthase
MTALPLTGRRVLVTRAVHQAGKLSEGLRALGAEPVEVPVLEIRPPADLAPLDKALSAIENYDWLILTSANTVRALAERAIALRRPLDQIEGPKVAAVGEATAEAARKAGLAVELVPENYVAESLLEALFHGQQEVPGQDSSATSSAMQEVSGQDFSRAASSEKPTGALAPAPSFAGQRILLARAEVARDLIPDALRAAGATVDVVDAYRNVLPETAPEMLRQAVEKGIDAATFTSSSSVIHLAEAAQKAGVAFPLPGVAALSIGPITTQTLREHGWEPAAEASLPEIQSLIAAAERLLHR